MGITNKDVLKTVAIDVPNMKTQLEDITKVRYGQVDIKQFGAKGDGINDDTSAFQDAINFCQENSTTLLISPSKKYIITSPMLVYKDICIMGTNNNINSTQIAKIECRNCSFLKSKTGTYITLNISLKNFSVEYVGDYSNECSLIDKITLGQSIIDGCIARSFDNIFRGGLMYVTKIQNNTFLDIRKSFLTNKDDIDNIQIVDSFITNNYINGSVFSSNTVGIDIKICSHSKISGNFIDFWFTFLKANGSGDKNIITDNQIQYCYRFLELINAGNYLINSNSFSYCSKNYLSKWSSRGTSVDNFIGDWVVILIKTGGNRINVTNNIFGSCDIFIKIDGYSNFNIYSSGNIPRDSNATTIYEPIKYFVINKLINNDVNDGKFIYIDELNRLEINEQPFNLIYDKVSNPAPIAKNFFIGQEFIKNNIVLKANGVSNVLLNIGTGEPYLQHFQFNISDLSLSPNYSISGDKLIYSLSGNTTYRHLYSNFINVQQGTFMVEASGYVEILQYDSNSTLITKKTGNGCYKLEPNCTKIKIDFVTNAEYAEWQLKFIGLLV